VKRPAPASSSWGRRRSCVRRWAAALGAAGLLAGALAPVEAQRRYVVAFANLTEEPGVTLEGTGFTGREIRESFVLAARAHPLEMVFYDNQRDDARAVGRALRRTGIEHLARRRLGTLSAGERQLATLARGLVPAKEGLPPRFQALTRQEADAMFEAGDGRVTLFSVECLCACEHAPMMQVDDRYEFDLTPEKVDRILEGLR